MKYILSNVPAKLDEELRLRAWREGRSLNDIALEAMARGVGHAPEPVRYRDLSGVAGSWKEDPEFNAAIDDQDAIDPAQWPM